ncbi:MAG: NotI family restriction endonuclease [Candidatus Zixiibacteriota bacterium]
MTLPRRGRKSNNENRRYGIGEWYGRLADCLTAEELALLANLQGLPKHKRPPQPCPFREPRMCNKEGGVCSLRLYAGSQDSATSHRIPGDDGSLRATCPNRFYESGTIFEWVGEVVLRRKRPSIAGEVGFLEQPGHPEDVPGESVGRIDCVLVSQGEHSFDWCALEIQAVYFSGESMRKEFRVLQDYSGPGLPFPIAKRRPDYRSSGPKRLMPQLQIKVPTLRRWGKKMVVVVDTRFFAALGRMDEVADISNCDIAWFVVEFEESKGTAKLVPAFVRFTTLERAVDGLTGGTPVNLDEFERRIRAKLVDPS